MSAITIVEHSLGEIYFEESAYWVRLYGEKDETIKCKGFTEALEKLEQRSDRFEQSMESMERE